MTVSGANLLASRLSGRRSVVPVGTASVAACAGHQGASGLDVVTSRVAVAPVPGFLAQDARWEFNDRCH